MMEGDGAEAPEVLKGMAAQVASICLPGKLVR
jgi:hypothetical protein